MVGPMKSFAKEQPQIRKRTSSEKHVAVKTWGKWFGDSEDQDSLTWEEAERKEET